MTPCPLSRSVIHRSIATASEVFRHFGIALPEFAFWSVEQWDQTGPEADEIRNCLLGWDVTDFGSKRFSEIGRTLFTLRNGRPNDRNYPKTYAEKLILDPEGQRAPAHFHRSKREDIINRAGGNLLIELTAADAEGQPSAQRFTIAVDGVTRTLGPRDRVRLKPGQSLCIPPGTIHQFWGEEGTGWRLNGVGYTVSSEVSSVCDDYNDNAFLESAERFPQLVEDEPRRHYLCHEYPKAGLPTR